MQSYELSIILDTLEYTKKQEWEQTRMLGYIIALTNSTKELDPQDIMKFSWDKKKVKDDKLTKKDIDRLSKKMNKIINKDTKDESSS